jgi:serine/threonine-protein kinase
VIPHPTTDVLDRFLAGDGGPAAEDIEAHVETCAACRAALDRLTAFDAGDLLRLLPGGGPHPNPPSHAANIPGYEVVRELGCGGFGVVYLARERALGRLVAVKLVRHGLLSSPAERAALVAEARVLARLGHPHIVPVYQCGEVGGVPYYVSEYLPGGSLARRLDGTPWAAGGAARLVRTLAEAVQHAHENGVVHRDLKPANVLLADAQGPPVPKVCDFGLAKLADAGGEPTPTRAVVGTPSYMAPEQALGRTSAAGPGADVYALGAILYELLTGRPPFRAETPFETLLQVREADPAPPSLLNPKVPRDLETVCLQCLRKEPERRYPSAEGLAADLRRFLDGEPVSARREGWGGRAVRRARRHPAVAAAAATAVVLAAGACGVLAWADARGREQEAAATARAMVDSLGDLETARVPDRVRDLAPYRPWADPLLADAVASAPPASKRRLHAALALVEHDPAHVEYLTGRLLTATPAELLVVRKALEPYRGRVSPRLWEASAGEPAGRFRAACALAAYAPDDPRWAGLADDVISHLTAANPLWVGPWAEALMPARGHLLPVLAGRLEGGTADPARRRLLAELYRTFAGEDEGAFRVLEGRTSDLAAAVGTDAARRRAGLAEALARAGRWEAARAALRLSSDPTARSHLIERLGDVGAEALAARVADEPDVTVRRALLLGLGGVPPADIPAGDRDRTVSDLVRLFRTDPDCGVHGAAEWVLRQWGRDPEIAAATKRLVGPPPPGRQWFVNPSRQTFTVIAPPDARMTAAGGPHGPWGVSRPFAVMTTEVTREQFRQFTKHHPGYAVPGDWKPLSPDPDGPAIAVLWHEAAAYCNWLSRLDGIPEGEWCYATDDAADRPGGIRPAPNFLDRSGYRLPTAREWAFAAWAGSRVTFAFGRDEDLFARYGWSFGYARHRAWPAGRLKPNDYGLFDVWGNVTEWCESPDTPGRPHVLCGGSFLQFPAAAVRPDTTPWPPLQRGQAVGFRVARTWK